MVSTGLIGHVFLFFIVTAAQTDAFARKRFDRLMQWNPLDPSGLDYDETARDPLSHQLRYVRKKAIAGHPQCPPTEPFMCPGTNRKCIALSLVCDLSLDCPDGYDEDKGVCAAAKRPPVRQTVLYLENLIKSRGANFFEKFFGSAGKDKMTSIGGVDGVAILLSESPTIDDFAASAKLSAADTERFRGILQAMESGNLDALREYGLSDAELADTKYLFDKFIATGFLKSK